MRVIYLDRQTHCDFRAIRHEYFKPERGDFSSGRAIFLGYATNATANEQLLNAIYGLAHRNVAGVIAKEGFHF